MLDCGAEVFEGLVSEGGKCDARKNKKIFRLGIEDLFFATEVLSAK